MILPVSHPLTSLSSFPLNSILALSTSPSLAFFSCIQHHQFEIYSVSIWIFFMIIRFQKDLSLVRMKYSLWIECHLLVPILFLVSPNHHSFSFRGWFLYLLCTSCKRSNNHFVGYKSRKCLCIPLIRRVPLCIYKKRTRWFLGIIEHYLCIPHPKSQLWHSNNQIQSVWSFHLFPLYNSMDCLTE